MGRRRVTGRCLFGAIELMSRSKLQIGLDEWQRKGKDGKKGGRRGKVNLAASQEDGGSSWPVEESLMLFLKRRAGGAGGRSRREEQARGGVCCGGCCRRCQDNVNVVVAASVSRGAVSDSDGCGGRSLLAGGGEE